MPSVIEDRFRFNAIVSSYYDIDTPEHYEEFEPQFYLRNVDLFCNNEVGITYDDLFETIKKQSKNLTEKQIGQIMQHFEDNSNSPECDFVTIIPDKILQCTGLKDHTGKLIYEGDIVKLSYNCGQITLFGDSYSNSPEPDYFIVEYSDDWQQYFCRKINCYYNYNITLEYLHHTLEKDLYPNDADVRKRVKLNHAILVNDSCKFSEVIGNRYERPELLESEEV